MPRIALVADKDTVRAARRTGSEKYCGSCDGGRRESCCRRTRSGRGARSATPSHSSFYVGGDSRLVIATKGGDPSFGLFATGGMRF